MKKVTSILPSWESTKTGSKAGFDKAWQTLDKLGGPVNRFSNKIGSEAFWPTTLDKESEKAARILKTFCKDGFYVEEDRPQYGADVIRGKQRVLKKIPQKVIENAVGLAIFTTMRSGLWISGAGGSGVLVARMENGEWSPPSGILLHTAGLGFLIGIDIYDCVVVINNRKALTGFTKLRATIGGEISAVAGPFGVGGILENDGKWKQANRPVFTYLKSRGFYAGVQVDGTVIIERNDENERFYGQKLSVNEILGGKVRHPPYEIKMLMETLKSAEGRSDVDNRLLHEIENEPAPADMEITSPTIPTFGIPEPDDPDPYGVLALEKEGFEIREAGTKSRPSSTQFEYNPSPTSPIYGKVHRQSMDTLGTKSNRESYVSTRSVLTRTSIDRSTQTSDFGTQTGDTTSKTSSIIDETRPIAEEDELQVLTPEEVDYTKIDLGPFSNPNYSQELDGTTVNESPREQNTLEAHTSTNDELETDDEEEPVIFEAASASQVQVLPSAIKVRGGLVNIPKRPPPPPLPPRSVARTNSVVMVDQASGRSPIRSPTKEGFEEVDLHGVDSAERKSVEHKNGIVMQDLEEDTQRVSLDEKVDQAFNDVHLEKIEGETGEADAVDMDSENPESVPSETTEKTEIPNVEATKLESQENQTPGGFPDSLPSTPLEVEAK